MVLVKPQYQESQCLLCPYLAFHSPRLPEEVVNNPLVALTSYINVLSGREPGLARRTELISTSDLHRMFFLTCLSLWLAPFLEIQTFSSSEAAETPCLSLSLSHLPTATLLAVSSQLPSLCLAPTPSPTCMGLIHPQTFALNDSGPLKVTGKSQTSPFF